MHLSNYLRTAMNEVLGHGHLCCLSDASVLAPIRRQLHAIGVPLSSVEPSQNTIYGPEMAQIMADFPEMLEGMSYIRTETQEAEEKDWQCGVVSVAVLARSEKKLRQLLENDCEPNERNFRGQTPLHLSILWPEGIRLLLHFGANPNLIDSYQQLPIDYAILCQSFDTVRLLLEKDCWLRPVSSKMSKEYKYSIFENVLGSSRSIRKIFFSAIADRRERLRDLLIGETDRNRLNGSNLLANAIIDAKLDSFIKSFGLGVQIPGELADVGPKTVYHRRFRANNLSATVFRDPSTSVEISQQLYDLGFKDIDEEDEYGFTPLLESCSMGDVGMIDWLLKNGAAIKRVSNYDMSPLQLYLDHCSYKVIEAETVLATVRLLIQAGDTLSSRDGCRCLCAPRGCSPITAFLRMGDAAMSRAVSNEHRDTKFRLLLKIIRLVHDTEDLCSATTETAWRDLAQLDFFERHSFAHTCCHIGADGVGIVPEDRPFYAPNVMREFREHIDDYMDKYDEMVLDNTRTTDEIFAEWKALEHKDIDEVAYRKVLNSSRVVRFQFVQWRHGPVNLTGHLARKAAHFSFEIPDPDLDCGIAGEIPSIILQGAFMEGEEHEDGTEM
jgi:ankyrin repeat protein